MQNQNAMLDACEAGDVAKLQALFKKAGVRKGDNEFEPFFGEPVLPTGPPPTATMIAAAVAHKQHAIVKFLLSTYRNVHIDRESIVNAILESPDVKTLEALCAYDPKIVDFEFRESRTTLLMEACRGSDPFLPTCLLQLGADPSECNLAGTGPLWFAVKHAQPFDIITRMIDHGAIVTDAVISVAIERRYLQCLKFLLDRARLEDPKRLLKQAEKTEDKAVVALIWERSLCGKKSPLKRKRKQGGNGFVYEERTEGTTKWWHFGR